jgi:hypothetical protein
MANVSCRKGFTTYGKYDESKVIHWTLASGIVLKKGDIAYIESAGHASSSAGTILGVCVGDMVDPDGNIVAAGEAALDTRIAILIDPFQLYIGEITTFALTDPYTTLTRTAAFDVAGSTGVQYIDAGASSNDQIQVICLASEYDTGSRSAIGANAKVIFQFNPDKCLLSTDN